MKARPLRTGHENRFGTIYKGILAVFSRASDRSCHPKIRVLMITARADYGGGPEHLQRLIETLPDDIQPFIACPGDVPYWDRFTWQLGESSMIRIPHRRFTLRHLLRLWWFVQKHSIDLIHSHGTGAGVYGRFLGLICSKPNIHTFHGIHIGYYTSWQKHVYIALERLLGAFSSRLITVSKGEHALLRAMKLCSPEKVKRIENGVRIPTYWRGSDHRHHDGKFRIISMSRFNYQKNSELLIPVFEYLRMWRGLHDLQLVLLGSGPGQEAFMAEIARRGLQAYTVLHGAVPNPHDYLHMAFCYLSTSRWEGMSLALLEAMAIGLPIIATNVVGNKDVVDHSHTGFLYDLSSPATAAQYVGRLIDDPGLWRRLSWAAKTKATNQYSAHRMAQETASVYRELYTITGQSLSQGHSVFQGNT